MKTTSANSQFGQRYRQQTDAVWLQSSPLVVNNSPKAAIEFNDYVIYLFMIVCSLLQKRFAFQRF